MRASKRTRSSFQALLAGLVVLVAIPLAGQKEQEFTPEELVAKHLTSIGSPEARAAVKTRVADGTGTMIQVSQGSSPVKGPALLLQEGKKLAFQIQFGFPQYPEELFAFDGNKTQIRRTRPEARSRLGEFFFAYGQLLQEGLFGGTLSTSWPLLNRGETKPELRYAGLEKVGEKNLHRLKYRTHKGAGDFEINLYFDPETYRHVRTVYKLEIRSGMRSNANLRAGSVAESEQVTRYKLEEDFSDFQLADGLTLPKHWKIRLTSERPRGGEFGAGVLVYEWDVVFSELIHNEAIEPKSFTLQ